jgi:RimJ/RimL family protein N-acetyltransferase
MRLSASATSSRRWSDLLIESDRQYFAAGATLHRVPGGHLAAMPGLTRFPAGAVVLVDDPGAIVRDPSAWRESAAFVCAKRNAALLRFYTPAKNPKLTRALESAGLASEHELAMAASVKRILASGGDDDDACWSIREVNTPALWREKRRLHELTPERPDGKAVDAASWVKLERSKVKAGYMSAWLIARDDEACGAFGLSFPATRERAQNPALVRFKNLFVAPAHRARGAATAALRLIAREVLARGSDTRAMNTMIGCFVLPDAHSQRVYERVGFRVVGRQLEWIAPVASRRAREVRRNVVGG